MAEPNSSLTQFDSPFEPVGQNYVDLLETCARFDLWFSIYHGNGKAAKSKPYAALLDQLISGGEIDLVSETPTTIYGGPDRATIRRLQRRFDENCLDLLLQFPHCLYVWDSWELWDDVCLSRPDGSLLMGSIGHELFWWLSLREEEVPAFMPLIEKAQKNAPSVLEELPTSSRGRRISGPVTWYGHTAAVLRRCIDISDVNEAYLERMRMDPGNGSDIRLPVLTGLEDLDAHDVAGQALLEIRSLYLQGATGLSFAPLGGPLPLERVQLVIDFGDVIRSGKQVRSLWNDLSDAEKQRRAW